MAGVYYGILGVIGLCAIFGSGLRTIVRLHNLSNEPAVKSWCWALGTILVSIIITLMGVDLFGQTRTIFYCILGMVGSAPNLCSGQTRLQFAENHTS